MGSNHASTGHTPYWNVNVPAHRHTVECPPYLADLPPKDLRTITTLDSDYQFQTWDRVREIARTNRLDLFERIPSEYRRYRAFTWGLKQKYGSIGNFMLGERLRWEQPIKPRGGAPFECPEDDVKVLYNDWPYGVDPRIVHLAVWTKFPLEEDPATGDLTQDCRRLIETFMDETFYRHVCKDQVIWFRNWSAIKSVHAVEHFHVMLYDPDPAFVARVTNGDVPQCSKPDS